MGAPRPPFALRPGVPADVPACGAILRALPEWFGIEAAICNYVEDLGRLPFWAALDPGAAVIGFLALRRTSPLAFDIHVMACRPDSQGAGVGSALIAVAEDFARAEGARLLQVKTLGPSHPDPNYARTRKFYDKMGFLALEELPADTLWPGNPCLILVKAL